MILTIIHPILVHFTIALLTLATLSHVYVKLFHKPDCTLKFADGFLFLGIFFTIFTVIFGFVSWHQIVTPALWHTSMFQTLVCHRNAALASFTVYLVTTAWRAQQILLSRKLSWWVVGLSIIGFILLCLTGWYGGELVYQFHVV